MYPQYELLYSYEVPEQKPDHHHASPMETGCRKVTYTVLVFFHYSGSLIVTKCFSDILL